MNDFSHAIRRIFAFTRRIEGFKHLERWVGQVFWRDYPQPTRWESDADHTWRMAMILTLLEPHLAQPIDFRKAMTMCLIHDLPELIAGDQSPLGTDGTGTNSHAYNPAKAKEKFTKEAEAAHTLFSLLPDTQRDALLKLWHEFEAQSSYEANIVKAIDKLEGKLQAIEYSKGVLFPAHFAFTENYGVNSYDADPATAEFGKLLLELLRSSYKEYTPEKSTVSCQNLP